MGKDMAYVCDIQVFNKSRGYLIIFTISRSVHQVMNVSQMEFGKVNAPYLKIPVQVVIMGNLLVEFSAKSAHVH
jgi:hypothetical protein